MIGPAIQAVSVPGDGIAEDSLSSADLVSSVPVVISEFISFSAVVVSADVATAVLVSVNCVFALVNDATSSDVGALVVVSVSGVIPPGDVLTSAMSVSELEVSPLVSDSESLSSSLESVSELLAPSWDTDTVEEAEGPASLSLSSESYIARTVNC